MPPEAGSWRRGGGRGHVRVVAVSKPDAARPAATDVSAVSLLGAEPLLFELLRGSRATTRPAKPSRFSRSWRTARPRPRQRWLRRTTCSPHQSPSSGRACAASHAFQRRAGAARVSRHPPAARGARPAGAYRALSSCLASRRRARLRRPLGGGGLSSPRRRAYDIGLVALGDRILLKEGRLDPEELAEMRSHPVVGYELTKGIPSLEPLRPFILRHHERIDGSGYPGRPQGAGDPGARPAGRSRRRLRHVAGRTAGPVARGRAPDNRRGGQRGDWDRDIVSLPDAACRAVGVA